jgi:hypothetical protein
MTIDFSVDFLLFLLDFDTSFESIISNEILLAPRKFFIKTFFFFFTRKTSPGSEKKKLYFEKFAGRLQYIDRKLLYLNSIPSWTRLHVEYRAWSQ